MTVLQLAQPNLTAPRMLRVQVYAGAAVASRIAELEQWLVRKNEGALSWSPRWLQALEQGFGHATYCIEARDDLSLRGYLPLAFVHSWLFGRFLVSLPYLNYGGVVADDRQAGNLLVDRALQLADELNV